MAFDRAYLGRSLDNRLPAIHEDVTRQVKALQNKHAAAGRLQSGATLTAFEDIATALLKSSIAEASKFTFEFTKGHEPEALTYLQNFAGRLQQIIMAEISEKASRLGLGAVTTNHMEKVRRKLESLTEQALDDFSHGMIGSDRLKKDDPVVSIINSQTNSPGAIQQVGVGKFSQTAFNEHHSPLVAAIDAALASDEFKALESQSQQAFKDIAEVVREEAVKPNPDSGKLQRWSTRLLEFAQKAGMRVAESTLVQVLVKIFF